MKKDCTGVILAGGKNKRFSGINKALVSVGGKRIIDRIYHVFEEIFDEIILVTNDPLEYLEWDMTIVRDLFQVQSSLTGIHAGLFYINTPYAFFLACDTPFVKKELLEIILAGIEQHVDVVIPETSKGFEPLCSIYSKQCLRPIEQQLIGGKLKIQGFFRNVRVKKIHEKYLRQKDPDLVSFFNINTPDDLIQAEHIESGKIAIDTKYLQPIKQKFLFNRSV
ncbi:MAG: molybdenum cofactor guanylyltransferase [Thermodesulfovibrionia bacterium]|nr:molybdenum cofactor guanylyltransferase [Thermodesulfovibrionia bacterium]